MHRRSSTTTKPRPSHTYAKLSGFLELNLRDSGKEITKPADYNFVQGIIFRLGTGQMDGKIPKEWVEMGGGGAYL